jgi:hypothetical protein
MAEGRIKEYFKYYDIQCFTEVVQEWYYQVVAPKEVANQRSPVDHPAPSPVK